MQTAPFFSDCIQNALPGRACWLTTADTVRIRIGVWNESGEKGTVLLFPGRTEYIEKYAHTAQDMAEAGFATLAIDWRGQGLADRLIDDPMIGHVGDFADYQLDVQAAVAAAEELQLPKPWFLLAHSMGGCIGLRALVNDLPVAASVFTGPMWGIKMEPRARPAAWALSWTSRRLGLADKLSPGTRNDAYVSVEPFADNTLTKDPGMYKLMQDQLTAHPELSLGGPSLNWLYSALRETLALSRLPAPALPCLTYLGGDERIVDAQRIRNRMATWPGGRLQVVPRAEHEVLMEVPETRLQVTQDIIAFCTAVAEGKSPFGGDGDGMLLSA
ncbi:Phospholipase YtpA [Thalassovita gelatinovora]|uniref:Phospholipase YtpA n=1 Tax=Thalassovita gelatinovora TaxID=53501 RepID=A0A0P1F7B5_THAGE|nr:alpha/beta hydrolase [Thalassovita gelatinovora]QIZ82250.1 alpha/beta hydrolase [Thalassovita gelatinovora]CUH63781.1 Phospholipase YtpA [Thalassovita gelatinovora]SEQ97754.1 lysophospholipase [Thalassovita gelatinovora]